MDTVGFLLKRDRLVLVNLNDPENLHIIGAHNLVTGGFGVDMAKNGEFIYVVTSSAIEIYHYVMDTLYHPIVHYDTFGFVNHVAIDSNILYIGNENGLYAYDISNFLNVQRIGSYTGFRVLGLDASDGYAFTSLGDIGMNVFQLSNLIGASEKPPHGLRNIHVKVSGDKVEFMAKEPWPGTMEIFDVSGRKILEREFRKSLQVRISCSGVYLWFFKPHNGRENIEGKFLIVK